MGKNRFRFVMIMKIRFKGPFFNDVIPGKPKYKGRVTNGGEGKVS